MQMYLYFNPEIRLTKRTLRAEKEATVNSFVDDLNEQRRSAKQPRKRDPILHQVKSILEKHKLMEMYEVRLHQPAVQGASELIDSWQVELVRNEQVARNTRRYDGVTLLVAHPNVELSIEQAIMDYRNKNRVEADFRTIKSVLKLRPTFHRTDHKIRSHVTICVLSLLIGRLIERRLQHASSNHQALPRTAAALLATTSMRS
jgi:transposase